ncbi:MAG: DNA polymerase [Limnohabitans sp.]|nr:DNA polymerase [Limnohabitans sp.]
MELAILKYNKYDKGKLISKFYIKSKNASVRILDDLNFLEVERIKTIISFDFFNIIDDINDLSKYEYIDIEQQLKQILGLSKDYFDKTNKEWSFWFQLKKYKNDKIDIKEYRKIYENLIENTKSEEIEKALIFLVESLLDIYEKNKKELVEKSENQRFEQVERPLNTILFERTKKGIKIDVDLVKKYINEITIELYHIRNQLQLEHGIFSSNDYAKISQKIIDLSFTKNIDKIGTNSYYNFLKYHHKEFPLIELLYKEKRLNDSKTVLTRLGSFEEQKVYPFFEYFGTVTSRILVKNPSFQQLKREYRDVIIPELDKELIYIDYSQFEAGILAHIMQDSELIKLYNSGDIYSNMEILLNNNLFNREKCKSLFFLYSYGASFEIIQNRYTNIDLNIFFNKFIRFQPFKKELQDEFIQNKFVNTLQGNYRYKTPGFELEEDFGWLVSQKIQGTASLILKKAIIKVYQTDKEIEFLLPMHDAALYQVPKHKIEEKKIIIKHIFEEELRFYCSSLDPKTSFKLFTQ